jgi:hypothetical protein
MRPRLHAGEIMSVADKHPSFVPRDSIGARPASADVAGWAGVPAVFQSATGAAFAVQPPRRRRGPLEQDSTARPLPESVEFSLMAGHRTVLLIAIGGCVSGARISRPHHVLMKTVRPRSRRGARAPKGSRASDGIDPGRPRSGFPCGAPGASGSPHSSISPLFAEESVRASHASDGGGTGRTGPISAGIRPESRCSR